MACRNKKIKERFYITGLSGIELILGYPWLRDFNPQIDWPTNKLLGPKVHLSTLLHARYPHLQSLLKHEETKANQIELINWRVEPMPANPKPVLTRSELPLKEPKEQIVEEQVPEHYHKYLDIFAKPTAG
jgi:hypothetical protein